MRSVPLLAELSRNALTQLRSPGNDTLPANESKDASFPCGAVSLSLCDGDDRTASFEILFRVRVAQRERVEPPVRDGWPDCARALHAEGRAQRIHQRGSRRDPGDGPGRDYGLGLRGSDEAVQLLRGNDR